MKKFFLKNIAILSLGTILSRFMIFLFRVVSARELSLEDYGLLSLIISFYALTIMVSHFDINLTLSKFVSKYTAEGKELSPLYVNGLFCIIPTSLLAVAAFSIMLLPYDSVPVTAFIVILPVFLIYSLYLHNSGILQGLHRFKAVAFSTFLQGFFRFAIVAVFFYILGIRTLHAALIAFGLSLILPTLYTLRLTLPQVTLQLKHLDKKIIQSLYSFSTSLVISDVAREIPTVLPKYLLSLRSMSNVAIFDMSLMMFSPFNLVLANVPVTLIPLVSDKYVKTSKIPRMPMKKFLFVSLAFWAISYGVILLNLDTFVLSFAFGAKFLPSVNLFRLLVIILPFYTYSFFEYGILRGIGEVKKLAVVSAIVAIMAVPTFLYSIKYGQSAMILAYDFTLVLEAVLLYLLHARLENRLKNLQSSVH
jgi:stage V sporulation protein B